MRAMVLDKIGAPLALRELPDPVCKAGEVLIQIAACGVCRTDLHVVDGELPDVHPPVIPGHEVVGRVVGVGAGVTSLQIGQRVGVPWLGATCGHCFYCAHGRENLCDTPQFTGYTRPGGYAEMIAADARYAVALPQDGDDAADAPLLCAGLIGWRSLKIAGDGARIGVYGFGAAAHIVTQIARFQGREVFAFTRPGDSESQAFARSLGVAYAGDTATPPPAELDAAILYAPAGDLVPIALRAVRKGGKVVCAGIHMSDIPSFPYAILWGERELCSVANLTRADAVEFFPLARQAKVATHVRRYALADANAALTDLRAGRLNGAAVLVP